MLIGNAQRCLRNGVFKRSIFLPLCSKLPLYLQIAWHWYKIAVGHMYKKVITALPPTYFSISNTQPFFSVILWRGFIFFSLLWMIPILYILTKITQKPLFGPLRVCIFNQFCEMKQWMPWRWVRRESQGKTKMKYEDTIPCRDASHSRLGDGKEGLKQWALWDSRNT